MKQVEIPVEASVDLPNFVIKIGGVELSPDQASDVLTLSVHEEVGKYRHVQSGFV